MGHDKLLFHGRHFVQQQGLSFVPPRDPFRVPLERDRYLHLNYSGRNGKLITHFRTAQGKGCMNVYLVLSRSSRLDDYTQGKYVPYLTQRKVIVSGLFISRNLVVCRINHHQFLDRNYIC